MSFEIINWQELPDIKQQQVAKEVAAYTQGKLFEQPVMLPVSEAEVFAKYLACTAFSDDDFCGFVASTQPIEHNGQKMCEAGTLWVPKRFQSRGIAHALMQNISALLVVDNKVPYAFCNSKSINVLVDVGYEPAKVGEVPPAAFSLCVTCPNRPEAGCCDTPVIFKGVKND